MPALRAQNFMLPRLVLAVVVGGTAFSALGATRTVSFSAVARSSAENALVRELNSDSECVVSVSNLSNVSQRITAANFLTASDPGAGAYTLSLVTPSADMSRIFSSSAAVAGCVGQVLPPQSSCLMRVGVQVIDFAGAAVAQCVGKISVSDGGTSGVSGSVVASGAVQMVQEVQVLGGVLSGAYYASNTFTPSDYSGVPGSSLPSHNMNVACSSSCMASKGAISSYADGKWSEARCMAHCGTLLSRQVGGNNQSEKVTYWNWGALVPPKLNYWLDATRLAEAIGPGMVYSSLHISGVLKDLGGSLGYRSTIGSEYASGGLRQYHLIPPGEYDVMGTLGVANSLTPPSQVARDFNEVRAAFGIVGLDAFGIARKPIEGMPSLTSSSFATSSIDSRNCEVGRYCPIYYTSATGFTDTARNSVRPGGISSGMYEAGPMIAQDVSGSRNSPFGPHVQNYYTRTADPYFAGGMVYELALGSLTSICGGNHEALALSNIGTYPVTPSHPGDLGVGMQGNESLVCHHRHQLPDLFMRAQQSYPFAINGGQPF